MGLDKYKQKRDFKRTTEPKASTKKRYQSPIFVVQKHAASHLHYDFRIQVQGVLKSWAVPKGPSLDTRDKRLAMMVEDHPLDYADFEGIIPKDNYGAGTVMVWDRGVYEVENAKDAERAVLDGLEKGELKLKLSGTKLKGGFHMVKLKNSKEKNAWLFFKSKDNQESDEDIISQDKSVISHRTLDEIGRVSKIPAQLSRKLETYPKEVMPTKISPMLAESRADAFDDQGWIFEIKWDGYRIISVVGTDSCAMLSRKGLRYEDKFKEIGQNLASLGIEAVFDGEVVAVNDRGQPSFQLLQNHINQGGGDLLYYVFDILHLNGRNLRQLPLIERKAILESVLPRGQGRVRLGEYVKGTGKAFFRTVQGLKLEGMIGKKANSSYREGRRSADWVKVKIQSVQDAIICGWTEPRGGRKGFGALILGVYGQDGRLTYIGHSGGGFTEADMESIKQRLDKLQVAESPFADKVETNEKPHWVKPVLVCQIKFTEWTEDGRMRHPIFLGLIQDKVVNHFSPEGPLRKGKTKVLKEGAKEVIFTHLERELWPGEGILKQDVVNYYSTIFNLILPYLADRPESLNRFPHGIGEENFYQKNNPLLPEWAESIVIRSDSEDKQIRYLICNEKMTLMYMIQLGCIEMNPWNSRVQNLDNPDYLVLDLDPGDIPFYEVVKVALVIHELLEKAGINNYCKTSGATGLHIYVPLGAKYSYEQVRMFSELIASMVHKLIPSTTSIVRDPKKRTNLVYIDYLQNRRGQTMAAPYSIRPRSGATVSMPLDWKEVNRKLDPMKFNIKTALKRVQTKGDLWKPVLKKGVDLLKGLDRLKKLDK